MAARRFVESYRYDLYNRDLKFVRTLSNVEQGGRISGSLGSEIGWSGDMTITNPDTSIDWSKHFVRVILTRNGADILLGTFVVVLSSITHKETGLVHEYALYDTTYLLSSAYAPNGLWYGLTSLDYKSMVEGKIGFVTSLPLTGTGWRNRRAPHDIVYPPTTSALQFVNDVLDRDDMKPITSKPDGTFYTERIGAQPTVSKTLTPGEDATYIKDVPITIPQEIPTHVMLRREGDPGDMVILESPDPRFNSKGQGRTVYYDGGTVDAEVDAGDMNYRAACLLRDVILSSGYQYKIDMMTEQVQLGAYWDSEYGKLRVTGIDIECTPGALMSVTAKEVLI